MYSLHGVAFLKEGSLPAFGIPIFTRKNSNYSYISEMDNFHVITSFAPVINLDGFYLKNSHREEIYKVGSRGCIAAISKSERVFTGDIEFFLTNFRKIEWGTGNSIFYLNAARVLGYDQVSLFDAIEGVRDSREVFPDEKVASTWAHIERESNRSDVNYWRDFHRFAKIRARKAYNAIGFNHIEDALLWLISKHSWDKFIWYDVWCEVIREHPFDERLITSSIYWMSKNFDDRYNQGYGHQKHQIVDVLTYVIQMDSAMNHLDTVFDIISWVVEDNIYSIPVLVKDDVSLEIVTAALEHSGGERELKFLTQFVENYYSNR